MATTSKMNIQRGILPDADPVLWFDVEGVGRLDAEGVVGDIQTTVIGDVFDQSSESLNILVADFCHGSPHSLNFSLSCTQKSQISENKPQKYCTCQYL